METLSKKTWTQDMSISKKYLSRIMTHGLSHKLNHEEYEVVFEIALDKSANSEPDVVVFDKRRGGTSVMAVEICRKDEIDDMISIAKNLMSEHSLSDFFIFDEESKIWYNIHKENREFDVRVNSNFMGVDLNSLQY